MADHFAFARRDFGQPVTASEILALVQGLPGVRGVVLTALRLAGETSRVRDRDRILAQPRLVAGTYYAAELLTLGTLDLTELVNP